MPAAGMAEIIGPAVAEGRGVGAFNIIGIEHAEAVIAGAEAAGAPVVLAISQNCVAYHGALEPIACWPPPSTIASKRACTPGNSATPFAASAR